VLELLLLIAAKAAADVAEEAKTVVDKSKGAAKSEAP